MANSFPWVLLTLVASAAAAPREALISRSSESTMSGLPRCSRECPVSGMQVFKYSTNYTYTYEYEGRSKVGVRGDKDTSILMNWKAEVDLKWITPCDMAILIRNPSIDGNNDLSGMRERLTRYPMVVAVSEGEITDVCFNHDDEPYAVNMKKGIASALQNTLPTLSEVHSGKTFWEQDILGMCPTKYTVERHGQDVIVTKEKDQKKCKGQMIHSSESQATSWIQKALYPVQESKAVCRQVFKDNIIRSVNCRDHKAIASSIGTYQFMITEQESELRFLKEHRESHSYIRDERIRRTNLTMSFESPRRREEVVPRIEELMREVCRKTEGQMDQGAASSASELLHLLKRCPQESIKDVFYKKVLAGEYCSDPRAQRRLRSIFLDAVAFIGEPGAVPVMAEEIMERGVSRDRQLLYAAAITLMPRPDVNCVSAIKPLLLETSRVPSMLTLASATMLNNYCRLHKNCLSEHPVREAMDTLASRITESCHMKAQSMKQLNSTLTLIKAAGNLANKTKLLESALLKCTEAEDADFSTRSAASRSLMKHHCKMQVTNELIKVTLDSRLPVETRVNAYLSSFLCYGKRNLSLILDHITRENSTQVRGFILSHMTNLQSNDMPAVARIRSILASYSMPTNFTYDPTKYSFNAQRAYYSPDLEMGMQMEGNVVYSPRSPLPSEVTTRLSLDLFGSRLEPFEIGIRQEGLNLTRSKAYLHRRNASEVLRDAKKHSLSIAEELYDYIKKGRELHILKDLFSGESPMSPKFDMFLRVLGQEISFASFAGKSFEPESLLKSLMSYSEMLFERKFDMDTTRLGNLNIDLRIPTMQGIPLKMKLNGTMLLSMKVKGDVDLKALLRGEAESRNSLKIIPSFAGQLNGFIGYNFGAKVGLQFAGRVHSSAGMEMKVDKSSKGLDVIMSLIEQVNLGDIEMEMFLMKKLPHKAMEKVHQSPEKDVRVRRSSCLSSLKNHWGVDLCYDADVPNVFHSSVFPLGRPMKLRLYARKPEQSELLRIAATLRNEESRKGLELSVEVPKSSDSEKARVGVEYVREADERRLNLFGMIASNGVKSSRGVKVVMKTGQDSNSLHAYYGPEKEPTMQVIEAGWKCASDGESKDISAHFSTLNKLRESVKVIFEFRAKPRFPYSSNEAHLPSDINLEVARLDLEVRQLIVHGSIQGVSENAKTTSYHSKFYARHNDRKLITLDSRTKVKGTVDYSYLEIDSIVDVTALDHPYKANCSLLYSKQHKHVDVMMTYEGANIFSLYASHKDSQSDKRACHTKMELNIPKYMSNRVSIGGTIQEEESSRYAIDYYMKRGDESVLHLTGPITVMSEGDTFHHEYNLNLMGSLLNEQFKLLVLAMEKPEEKDFKLNVQSSAKKYVSSEISWKKLSSSSVDVSVDLHIPRIAESSSQVSLKENSFHLATKTKVLMESQCKAGVSGYLDLDKSKKEIDSDLTCTFKNTERKISTKAKYDINMGERRLYINGRSNLDNDAYQYKVDLDMGLPSNEERKTGVILEFHNPSGKTMRLDSRCHLKRSTEESSMHMHTDLRTFSGHKYSAESNIRLQHLYCHRCFGLQTRVTLSAPERSPLSLRIEARSERKSEDREITFETKVDGLKHPIDGKMNFILKRNSYDFYVRVAPSSYSTEVSSKGSAQFGSSRMPEHFDVTLKAKVEGRKRNEVSLKVSKSSESKRIEVSLKVNQKNILRGMCKVSEPRTWTVLLESTSRSVEGVAKLTDSEMFLSVHPEKEKGGKKYQVAAQWNRHNAQISSKHMPLVTSRVGDKITGEIVLDIFSDENSKIIATITSSHGSHGVYSIEGKIRSKKFTSEPHFKIRTSWTSGVKSFALNYTKSDSAPMRPLMDIKFHKRSSFDADLYFLLNREHSPIEVSSLLRKEQGSQCQGYSVLSSISYARHNSYDVAARACSPMYVEAAFRKGRSEVSYIGKAGMKRPERFVAGLEELRGEPHGKHSWILHEYWKLDDSMGAYDSWIPRRYLEKKVRVQDGGISEKFLSEEIIMQEPVSMTYLDLWVPTLISTEFYCNPSKLEQIEREIRQMRLELVDEVKRAIECMRETLLSEGSSFHLPEIIDEIIAEIKVIYQDIYSDLIVPLENVLKMIVREIRDAGEYVYAKIESFIEYIKHFFKHSKVPKAELIASNVMDLLHQAAKDLRNYWDNDLREKRQEVVDFIRRTKVYEYIEKEWGQMNSEYPEELSVMKNALRRTYKIASENVTAMFERIANTPTFHRYIVEIYDILYEEPTNSEAKVLSALFNKVLGYFFKVSNEESLKMIRFPVPLYRPASSLVAALTRIGPPSLHWLNPTLMEIYDKLRHGGIHTIFPPYSYYGWIINNHIVTFDGRVVNLRDLGCSYKLVETRNASVIIEAPGSDNLKVIIKTSEHEVTLSPREGAQIDKSPISMECRKSGSLRICQSKQMLNVSTPMMTISMDREAQVVSVRMKPWAYNTARGLLGTNNSEMEDDTVDVHGKLMSSEKEFADQWKLSKSCQSPGFHDPQRHGLKNYYVCAATIRTLSIVSGCYKAVSTEPYIKTCNNISTCEVVDAYRHACLTKDICVYAPFCHIK